MEVENALYVYHNAYIFGHYQIVCQTTNNIQKQPSYYNSAVSFSHIKLLNHL